MFRVARAIRRPLAGAAILAAAAGAFVIVASGSSNLLAAGSIAALALAGVAGFSTMRLHQGRTALVRDLERLALERDRLTDELARVGHEMRWTRSAVRDTRERLADAARLAEAGELAATVAHEVSGPLTGIVVQAELALDELPPLDPARPVLAAVRDDALRAAQVLRAMVLRARGTAPEAQPVDLPDVVAAAVEAMRPRAHRAGVRLHVNVIPANAPVPIAWTPAARSTADRPLVTCDPTAITQIISNLVANSVGALPVGGDVWVETMVGARDAEIRVIDDGVGMDERTLARAFEPFFTTRAASSGTGLGLGISRRLAEVHGGSLSAASAPGAGTTMLLRLPVRPNAEEPRGDRTPVGHEAAGREVPGRAGTTRNAGRAIDLAA